MSLKAISGEGEIGNMTGQAAFMVKAILKSYTHRGDLKYDSSGCFYVKNAADKWHTSRVSEI